MRLAVPNLKMYGDDRMYHKAHSARGVRVICPEMCKSHTHISAAHAIAVVLFSHAGVQIYFSMSWGLICRRLDRQPVRSLMGIRRGIGHWGH